MTYTIYATVSTKGTKRVSIETKVPREMAQSWGDRAFKGGAIADYQTATAESVKDIKSILMSNFGIGFFNAARKRIDQLEGDEFQRSLSR